MTDHLDKGPIGGEWQAKTLHRWERGDGAFAATSLPVTKRSWYAKGPDGEILRAAPSGRKVGKMQKGGGFHTARAAVRTFATAAAAMDACDLAFPLKKTATA
jgi:hypothetical protein